MSGAVKPMRRSVGQRLRYRFDNTISRGTLPVIGYLALLTVALVMSAALVLAITGTEINEQDHPGFLEAFWQSLLRILDPGTFSGDNGWFLRVVMLVVTLFGISIAAVLIGLIASGIEQRIEGLRRGRSAVIDSRTPSTSSWVMYSKPSVCRRRRPWRRRSRRAAEIATRCCRSCSGSSSSTSRVVRRGAGRRWTTSRRLPRGNWIDS